MKKLPNFSYEKRLWKKGYKFVAGCDEVGRGCFAGPVVAACNVFMPQNPKNKFQIPKNIKIDDSKKLSETQRNIAAKWIKDNCLTWGIGIGRVSEINRLGMTKATSSAFRRAITNANKRMASRVDYLLIDAFYIPYTRGLRMPLKTEKLKNKRIKELKYSKLSGRQLAIINGDEKSLSIAAASIIAKVYRDKLMKNLSKRPKFKKYVWDKNKGYGTRQHREAILKYGSTKYHRKKFVETYLSKNN